MLRKSIVIIIAIFIIVSSLACGSLPWPTKEYIYRIVSPDDNVWYCNDYTWTDNGDLELLDCVHGRKHTIINPVDVVITRIN